MSNVVKHPKAPVDHTSGAAAKPMLLDGVRARIRRLNYSIRTEDAYAKRLRELESENAKLKKLLAEAHLDIHALKGVFGVKR
jgi:putative transposase